MVLAAACWSLPASSSAQDTQFWLANSLTYGLKTAWQLKITQELRAGELARSDILLRNWSLGVGRSLPRNLHFAVSYKREWEEKVGFTRKENRLVLDGGWKNGLTPEVTFDVRLRSEFRRFEDNRATNHSRYRIRIRFRRRVKNRGRSMTPFVWTEIFSNPNSVEGFARVRSSLGANVRLSPRAAMQVGYLRQDVDDGDSIQALKLGFDLNL